MVHAPSIIICCLNHYSISALTLKYLYCTLLISQFVNQRISSLLYLQYNYFSAEPVWFVFLNKEGGIYSTTEASVHARNCQKQTKNTFRNIYRVLKSRNILRLTETANQEDQRENIHTDKPVSSFSSKIASTSQSKQILSYLCLNI